MTQSEVEAPNNQALCDALTQDDINPVLRLMEKIVVDFTGEKSLLGHIESMGLPVEKTGQVHRTVAILLGWDDYSGYAEGEVRSFLRDYGNTKSATGAWRTLGALREALWQWDAR